ncbi:hypothetical protein N7481_011927 [Penicillium waksmanii]|uniref:uncharacterized protein n=1 Tax=Penicillium waksmanii TaxID=69791 RepID=UPI0025482F2F|nr:uncharacterized protein N7481_011927 [Penicillium waksmanii]KAJ5974717.1 hypothetical protein N7481_011927 [Penicillium waksmanii]
MALANDFSISGTTRDEFATSGCQGGLEAQNPLLALRCPSSLLKSSNPVNPSAPPDRTTSHCNDKPLHPIPITYSTVAARALLFYRQVLCNVTTL